VIAMSSAKKRRNRAGSAGTCRAWWPALGSLALEIIGGIDIAVRILTG